MHSSRRRGSRGLSVLFHSLWRRLQQRRERSQHRRWLMEMDERLLKDIGLCRADVRRLYQRRVSGPAHERSDQKSQGDSISSMSSTIEQGSFSSCRGDIWRSS